LIWPLDYRVILTSNFAEYRIGHPHAGIDLGTNGKIGVPVKAVDQGTVWRVKTSPYGYGKAVYVKLADDRIANYGHLEAFSPRIEAYVRARQEKNGIYSLNAFPDPGEIPVKRGEVIGYAGATGTDAPHLHFEIRGADNCPTNPLLNGFPVADGKPPRPLRMCLEPLDRASSVEGLPDRRIYRLVKGPDGIYAPETTPMAWGTVGLLIEADDRSDTSHRILAPYSLRLLVEDEPLFEFRHDRFCYENQRIIDLQYDYGLWLADKGKFFRLYDRFGARTAFWGLAADGRIVLGEDGTRRVAVEAADAAGNRAVVRLDVLVDRPPVIGVPVLSDAGREDRRFTVEVTDPDNDPVEVGVFLLDSDGKAVAMPGVSRTKPNLYTGPIPDVATGTEVFTRLRVEATDARGARAFPVEVYLAALAVEKDTDVKESTLDLVQNDRHLRIEVRPVARPARPPMVRVHWNPPFITSSGEPVENTSFQAVDSGNGTFLAYAEFPQGWEGTVEVAAEVAGVWGSAENLVKILELKILDGGRSIASSDGAVEVHLPEAAAYHPFRVSMEMFDPPSARELVPVASGCRISRREMPFKKDAELLLRLPENVPKPGQIGVYLYSDGSYWYKKSSIEKAGGVLRARVNHLGAFALMRDAVPPGISTIRPKNGASVGNRRPLISFALIDGGSGLFERGIELKLDGKKVISEWRPYKGKVIYRPARNLSPGKHRLSVSVTDRAGNTATAASWFRILK